MKHWSLFHSLSPSEKEYIVQGINKDVRIDGRRRLDRRKLELATQILPHASGSATVAIDATTVLAGVQAKIGEPSSEAPDKGNFNLSVECALSPAFFNRDHLKEFKSHLQATLSLALSSSNALDLGQLGILSGQHCWTLYIDVFILYDGGNATEAAFAAIRAALYNLKLPRVTLNEGMSNASADIGGLVISNDPDDMIKLNNSDFPYLFTVAKIGNHFAFDPLKEEEACADCLFYIVLNLDGSLRFLQKDGDGVFSFSDIMSIIRDATECGKQLIYNLDKLLMKHSDESAKLIQLFQ